MSGLGVSVYGTNTNKQTCHYCGKPGHFQAQCKKRLRDIKEKSADSSGSDDEQKSTEKSKKKSKKLKANVNVLNVVSSYYNGNEKKPNNKDLLFVDSLSDTNFHCSNKLLGEGIRTQFSVECGMGEFEIEDGIMCDMWCLGPSAYLPKAGKSAVAEHELHKWNPKHVIGKYWRVTLPTGKLYFNWYPEHKAYALQLNESNLAKLSEAGDRFHQENVKLYAMTVRDKEKEFTKQEVTKARRARELCRVLCYPGVGALAESLSKSAWSGVTVRPEDIRLASDIYGKDPNISMGKSREPKNAKSNVERAVVPRELRGEQLLYADTFFWHEKAFFVCIAKPLYLVLTRDIKRPSVDSYHAALQWTLAHVRSRGFQIADIFCDADSLLAPLEEKIPNLHIAEAGGKVGDIEVEIRVLKEMLRSTEASLPVPILNKHINWLIRRATVMRNLVLRPNMTISPREAFTGRRSCESDLRLGWYDYVQAYRKPLNKRGPETLVSGGRRTGLNANVKWERWSILLRLTY